MPYHPGPSAPRLVGTFWAHVDRVLTPNSAGSAITGLGLSHRIARLLAPTAVDLTEACERLMTASDPGRDHPIEL